MQMKPIDKTQFEILFSTLHRFAMHKGISYHDAEDLVSVCITKALDSYDPAKGKLLSYCSVILSNDIVNHWRSRRHTDSLPEETSGDDSEYLDGEEEISTMRNLINQLSGLLTDEERTFMLTLGQVLEELGERTVLETARRLNYDPPVKGHDVLRRIRRKAETLRTETHLIMDYVIPLEVRDETAVMMDLESPAPSRRRAERYVDDPTFDMARAMSRKASSDRLYNALTQSQLNKLATIPSLI